MTGDVAVTVVVPVFNGAATLQRTLDSIAAQTFVGFEVIVIDDGSTDNSVAIAAAMHGRIKKLQIIQLANGGVARARNAGIAAGRGQYVAPIDADDLWHPTYLERLVRALRQAPGAGFAYALFRRIDADDMIVLTRRGVVLQGFAFHRMVYSNPVGNGSGMLFERAEALAFGGYEEAFPTTADNMMQLRLAWRREVVCVPQYLVGYRLAAGSMSRDRYSLADRSLRALAAARDAAPGCDTSLVNAVIARRAARAMLTAISKADPPRMLNYFRTAAAADLRVALATLAQPWRFKDPRKSIDAGLGQPFALADPHPPPDFERREPHFLRELAKAAAADQREASRRQD